MKFPSKQTLQNSGILFSIFFATFFGLIPYLLKSEIRLTIIFISLIILLISFVSPYSLRNPYLLWIKLGEILGKFNSKIVLIFFFYIFITPVAILKNLYSLIIKLFAKNKSTYYRRDQLSDKVNLKDQF
tara:strand:- start:816 stop:1202 length:387 start_codon:yes stop_codon:yes gene_type:complete